MKASFNILLPILSLSESVADRQASGEVGGRREGGRRKRRKAPRGKRRKEGFEMEERLG